MRLDGYGLFVKDMPTMIRFFEMYCDLKLKKMKTRATSIC